MKTKLTVLYYAMALRVTLFAAVAFGQDAGTGAAAPAADAVAASPDVGGLASQLLGAIQGRKGALAVAILVLILTKVVMWAGKKYPLATPFGARLHVFLDSNLGSWGIPMAGSLAGAMVTSLSAGQGINLDVLLEAVLIGMAGGGLTAPPSPPPPAAPMTKTQAVAELKGP